MTNQHPITPPPDELVKQWRNDNLCFENLASYIATQAARWGAEQELHAICDWLDDGRAGELIHPLICARRPKPPSLKEQALDALREAESTGCLYVNGRSDLIRKALEALPND